MKNRNFIFGSLAGILFIAFTAVNVTVSLNSNVGNSAQLTFTELIAKANSGSEFYCSLDKYGAGICTSLQGDVCTIPLESCSLALY